jgi:hypothetical protein
MGATSRVDVERRPRLLPRALVLLALLALADLWANRHLDAGIDHPGVLATMGGALTAALGLMDRLGVGEGARAWVVRVWSVLGSLLSPAVLAFLWVVLILTMSTVSSVVVTNGDTEPGTVQLVPVASGRVIERLGEAASAQRFLVTTTPFGKRYEVRVDGFLPGTFDVPPLWGQTVAVPRDLRPLPTLLFRPPLPALASLERGRFVVYAKERTGRRQIALAESTRASFLVGRARPLPPEWLMLWRFELESAGAERPQVASALLDWSRRALPRRSGDIAPGMTLVAEVRSPAGKLVACREWVVGSDDVVDVPMRYVAEEGDHVDCRNR